MFHINIKLFKILLLIILISKNTMMDTQQITHNNTKESNTKKIVDKTEKPFGRIIIDKINIDQYFYEKNSPENTIEKHITQLKESTPIENKNSLLILAAHSGVGEIAYFEKLDQLQVKDIIRIYIQNVEYIFEIKDIWEEKKNGFIHIDKEPTKQLILTTCSPKKKEYQLVLNATIKES